MLKILVFCACIILIGYFALSAREESVEEIYSDIAADETVVFFRTSAWLNEKTGEWHVPVHGWIYEPQDSVTRKTHFAAVLASEFDLEITKNTDANFSRRLNLMIADNERDKQIVIKIAEQEHILPPSDANGHFSTMLTIPAAITEEFAAGPVMTYSAVTGKHEKRNFTGEVLLVGPSGISVISDIDDTVKISDVTDRKKLLENTFLLDFAEAPGMARLYSEWAIHDVSFHFVSSSPWQLYAPLYEFLEARGFPPSEVNLKAVRFRDETLFDLFRKGTETKPPVIEKILATYPDRQFFLVGDSGEQDPEVYAALLRTHPDQILKVLIRNVTAETRDDNRFATLFEGINDDRWQLFDRPTELTLD